MNSFLIPHPEATIEDLRLAIEAWKEAAASERFRAENNLCAGWQGVALHNAELYEKTAKELEERLQKMERMEIHQARNAGMAIAAALISDQSRQAQ